MEDGGSQCEMVRRQVDGEREVAVSWAWEILEEQWVCPQTLKPSSRLCSQSKKTWEECLHLPSAGEQDLLIAVFGASEAPPRLFVALEIACSMTELKRAALFP